ncbi:argininosuccinate synthase [Thermocladium modestius]|uniref:Argininosuccinate synthase n=1 Tax=Thermocladium modestius TaxID=62609 RepID=A0A830GWY7_9CREN|nr:argininosuccinate synthase [Thermocladium modestius]GGP20902.1 argininosuccinate synthase [Thermocladium modestius]
MKTGEKPSKIILAYSGGLDTTIAIHWLKNKFNADVITVTVDVGQEDDFGEIASRAESLGVLKHYTIDAKKEFAEEPVASAIMMNALYEDEYPLGTALARPLIAEKAVEVARREGGDAVAHGATSKGNDQIRFEETIKALSPDLLIIAPARIWGMDRKSELEYAERHGIPIPKIHGRFSIDDNLWTRSIEGPEVEDAWAEPPEDAFKWTVNPAKVGEDLRLEVDFEGGVPVAVNGERMELPQLISLMNKLVGMHGFGRVDHVENRAVGFKSREVYEAPAALALIRAHKDLEKLVYTPSELRFKRLVDREWADLVYRGLWHEPLRAELDGLARSMNRWVTGSVKLVVRGGLTVAGRSSPYSGYDEELAGYVRGWYPSDDEARGFIEMSTLHSLTAHRSRWGVDVS